MPADVDPGEPPAGQPVAAFRSPRRGLWGHGEALRIDVPAPWPQHVDVVADALAELRGSDDVSNSGSGPVAFAALPFDPTAAAQFVVPAVVHGHSAEGVRWTTTIGASGTDAGAWPVDRRDVRAPSEITVAAALADEQWCRAVETATDRIRAGLLTKVVLARSLRIDADEPIDAASLLARLRRQYPAAMTFAVDGFVGASPELLVSRVGDMVRAQPMAGTTPRTGEPEADQRRAGELLSSEKNRREHQITIDMVHDTLLPWCSFLDAEPSPSVVPAGPVQHLASIVEGRLSHPTPSVLDLVAALHPTPAVGGWPRAEALALIDELEHEDRGRYAGPVGWVDAEGNGAWAVGIRSVQLDGRSARLFAGVGVVEDSDPLAELEETRAKAQALLGSIVRL
ncbi:MAG: isochorismate synthase [Actinomycetota bacterium]|nr:isochorismate synthase [Actinomycetota bacterium]